MKDDSHLSRVGPPTYLDEDGKRAICEAALHILSHTGMRVRHQEVVALVVEAGASVSAERLVLTPHHLVKSVLATVPRTVSVYDREGKPAMELAGSNSYFGTGSDLLFRYDINTRERRDTVLNDVAEAALLCDALPNIDFVMSYATAGDIDAHCSFLEAFRAMSLATTKPIVTTAESARDLGVMWQIGCELRGSESTLRREPYFVVYAQPVSPLLHPLESMEKLLFCADKGIPVIYNPAPLAGATGPITVAGLVAQSVAETLFGLVVHQLRRPGAPFLFGTGSGAIDMLTSQVCYTAPEALSSYLCLVEMAKWFGIPNWGYAGITDSVTMDIQAGMETAELTLWSMLYGSNLNHDVGYLDWGLSGALEMIVVLDEFISLNRKLLNGPVIDAETLALEAIDEVGPGGDFLASRHTRRNMRTAQWRPTILNRQSYERWRENGGLDLREIARRKAKKIISTHQPASVDVTIRKRIQELIDGFTSQAAPATPRRQ